MIDPKIKQDLEFYLQRNYSKEKRLYCCAPSSVYHEPNETEAPKPNEPVSNTAAVDEPKTLNTATPGKEPKPDTAPAKTPTAPTPGTKSTDRRYSQTSASQKGRNSRMHSPSPISLESFRNLPTQSSPEIQ